MARKMPVFRLMLLGRRTSCFRRKEARPQQDGFPVDRAAKAALLIEAQVLSRFPWGVLPHRQSLKDPLQAAPAARAAAAA